MTIKLPQGWKSFNGGGADQTLCGEDQNGHIPSLVIQRQNQSIPLQLSCVLGQHELDLEIVGGVPPFIWAANGGDLIVTGTRTAKISIHNFIGPIAFYKVFADYFATYWDGVQTCSSPPRQAGNQTLAQVAMDVRLLPHDCLGILAFTPSPQLAPDNPTHPIGTVVGDRTCTLSFEGIQEPSGGTDALSDPAHWSLAVQRCTPGGNNVGVHVSAIVAGKNGINGTIWPGAPMFDEGHSVTIIDEPPPSLTTRTLNFDQMIDVRTQAMIDTGCCVVPAGTPVQLTVIDAENVVALMVIPVV